MMAEQKKPEKQLITEWIDTLTGRTWSDAYNSTSEDENSKGALYDRLEQVFGDSNKTRSQHVQEGDEKDTDTISEFITLKRSNINEKADDNPGNKKLSDFAFSSRFITDVKNVDHYWNESIIALVEKFNESIPKNPPENSFLNDYINIILNANAGFSFLSKPYVKPDLNIDGQTYEDVRGVDSIESVLRNNKNMQYTHTQEQQDGVDIGKYIRLLMPKYSRRVEVEDLNRNFWVIGQTIGTISAYLLDPGSALNQVLKGIISELAELWNNVFELWHEVGNLWGEIVYLWLKIGDIEDQINELAKASAKTVVNFNMNMMGSGQAPEWLNVFQEPSDNFRNYSYKVEWIYYLGEKDPNFDWNGDTENSSSPKVDMKSKVIESYKDFVKEIPWVSKYFKTGLTSSNGTGDDWVAVTSVPYSDYCVNWSAVDGGDTSGSKSIVTAPYIGFIVKYQKTPRSGGSPETHYAAYDYEHPYIVLNEGLFGPYRYTNTVTPNQTYLNVNRIIYEEVFKKHLEVGPTVSQIGDFITIERDKYNTRPMGEILEDLMGLNIILKDMSKSSLDYNHFSTIGIMPRKILAEKFVGLFLQYFSDVLTSTSFNFESEDSGVPYLESQALKAISDSFIEKNDLSFNGETLQSLSYYWNVFRQIFKGEMTVDRTKVSLGDYDSNIGHLQLSVVDNKISINDNNIGEYKELLEIILGHFGVRYSDYLKTKKVDSLPVKKEDGSPDFDFENGYKSWVEKEKADTIISTLGELMKTNALYSCSTPSVLFEYHDGWAKKANVTLVKDSNDIMYGMAKYLNSNGENGAASKTWSKDDLFKDGFNNGALTWRPWEIIFTGIDYHHFYCLPESENDLKLGSVCRCVETVNEKTHQKEYYMGYQGFYDYIFERNFPRYASKFTDTTTDPSKVTSDLAHVIFILHYILDSALVDYEVDPNPEGKKYYIKTCGNINLLNERIKSDATNKIDMNTPLVKIKSVSNGVAGDERARQYINALLSYYIFNGSIPATNLFKKSSVRNSYIQPFKSASGYWINFINESNGSGYRSMSYCSANFRNFSSYSDVEDLRTAGAMSTDDNFLFNSSVSFLLQNCSSDHKFRIVKTSENGKITGYEFKSGTELDTGDPRKALSAQEVPIQSEISKVIRFNDFLGNNFPLLYPYKREETEKWVDDSSEDLNLGNVENLSIYSAIGKGCRGLKGIELLHKNGDNDDNVFDSDDFSWGAFDFWFGTQSGIGLYRDKIYLKPDDYKSKLSTLDATGNGSDGEYHISILSLGKFFKEIRDLFIAKSSTGSAYTYAPPMYGQCSGDNKYQYHDIVFRETTNNVIAKTDYIKNLTFEDVIRFSRNSARLQLDFSKSKSTSSSIYTVNLGSLEAPDRARVREIHSNDNKRSSDSTGWSNKTDAELG